MGNIAIQVENLSKRYRIGTQEKKHDTLTAAAVSWLKSPLNNFRRLRSLTAFSANGDEANILYALKDISFTVNQGEVVGIIGRNGAGKSTLLKILSRITPPSDGRIILNGRVASLLEVGTGFHPELTGRENVYLNGTVLGMTKTEVDRKFDEIVDFSGVEKFIDTPVKWYSSGMRVRLAFSVAAHLEPEILLVDEVLAVGDAEFQQKCLGKMEHISGSGRTILFVSHQMGAITRLCPQSIWLDEGVIHMIGPTENLVKSYLTHHANLQGYYNHETPTEEVREFLLHKVCIKNKDSKIVNLLDARFSFFIEIDFEVYKNLPACRVGFIISTVDGITVFDSYDTDMKNIDGKRILGRFINRCEIPANLLAPGRYVLSVNIGIPGIKNLAKLNDILSFEIQDTGEENVRGRRLGVIRPQLVWQSQIYDPFTP